MGTGLDDLLAFVDDALRGRPQGPGLQGPEDSEPDYLAPGLRILAAPPARP
jgi:hypothetical protein